MKQPPSLYLDFSEVKKTTFDFEEFGFFIKNTDFSAAKRISIILSAPLLTKELVSICNEKKVSLEVAIDPHDDFFVEKHMDSFLDIKIQLKNDANPIALFKKLSMRNFHSIDFLLPSNRKLDLFAGQLIKLASYYFEKKNKTSILCIDQLVENYFRVKLNRPIAHETAGLVILLNGDILKLENYLYLNDQKKSFHEKWNVHEKDLIDLILRKEYYDYAMHSCMSRLEVESERAILEFVRGSENGFGYSPLIAFYTEYDNYLKQFISI